MAAAPIEHRVAAVRRFNRFYTAKIGVLDESHLGSPFSVAEARVLYELAHRASPTATELARDLGLDAGYLSRILKAFDKRRLIERAPSTEDGRRSHLSLTRQGQTAFAPLNARSRDQIGEMLGRLSTAEQARVVDAMSTIERLLGSPRDAGPYVLRTHQPGDMGWVVHRHGALYAAEYGWDARFEALVAGVVQRFIDHFDPTRERCWIAERDGDIVGSVFVVERSKTVAQLRLLLVEPTARGTGLGRRLVDECIRFARQTGYRKMTLWTNSVLIAALRIYERAGFHLVHRERHRSFGHDLIGETWELTL